MNRLQKKCFIASTGMHVLLVLILLVGPALASKSKMEEMPTIDFIPNKLIDAAFSGGGNPNTRPPPPAPPAPTPPAPAPPQREVAPPDPKPDPKPDVVKAKDPEPIKEVIKPKPVTDSLEVQQKPKRSKPEVTTKAVPRNSDSEKKQKQKAEADARAKELATEARAKAAADAQRRELAAAVGSAARSIKSELSPAVAIDTNPGPGGGGEAYANYAQVVKSIYEHAWVPSDDSSSDEAITKVSITIRRDGSVASARIIKRCGDASIDQSVQRTLDRVKFIAPFPEGAKDQERTFTINFNLKAKRMMG